MDRDIKPDCNVQILYEDNHLIVAVKPAGVLSQSDGSDAPDMLGILKDYVRIKYNKPGEVFIGLVHRLDRPVSGVMVFARTSKAASRLSEQIRSRTFVKQYRAVVEGRLEGYGGLENFLVKDPATNTVTVYDREVPGSKISDLRYRVIRSDSMASLIEINLGTGRGHQIRAQFAHISHPILGDRRYGGTGLWSGDIALQSYKIEFNHPTRPEKMSLELPFADEKPWNIVR